MEKDIAAGRAHVLSGHDEVGGIDISTATTVSCLPSCGQQKRGWVCGDLLDVKPWPRPLVPTEPFWLNPF